MAFLVLTGCASTIMGGYIGKPLSTVVSDYGFPSGAYDVDGTQRAFVWQMNNSVVIPGSSFTSGLVVGNQLFANTYTSPGYAGSYVCSYTLLATRTRNDIEGPAAWTVVGFQKPKFGCE